MDNPYPIERLPPGMRVLYRHIDQHPEILTIDGLPMPKPLQEAFRRCLLDVAEHPEKYPGPPNESLDDHCRLIAEFAGAAA